MDNEGNNDPAAPTAAAVAHPLWAVLAHQGRSLQWLARRTGYSESHVWAIKGGRSGPTPAFRARCAEAFDLPEFVLFHGDVSSARRSAPRGGTDPATGADPAVGDALYAIGGGAVNKRSA